MINSNTLSSPRLIESPDFPHEFVSSLAERESWRKEIYRPVYHIHKWWAKRLGSVFRSILLGSVLDTDQDLESAFYQLHEYPNTVVFDPFMGSGTTIGEAHKLGMTVFGRDINPVAAESVRVALSPLNRNQLQAAFQRVSSSVGGRIRQLYKAEDENGYPCDVLYYFWVKQVKCPDCKDDVDLFSSYVFAKNAYPQKKPEVQVVCPFCNNVFTALYHQQSVTCEHCKMSFPPTQGQAKGTKAFCRSCGNSFSIVQSLRGMRTPPAHRLYAKLILTPNGMKKYLPVTDDDLAEYIACKLQLEREESEGSIRLPVAILNDGYNTRQAMSYNYRSWRDFFNARQLLALGWLHEAIINETSDAERDALLSLFSGVLEFNNLFASYKGEGTGAVRHIFSHHILKPERMPIEANVWGTAKSSGSFSGLFRNRLLRALDYRDAPFEVGLDNRKRVFDVAKPMNRSPLTNWGEHKPGTVSLSCGDSASTELPENSVDLVVTDPPFFDNVHYSELADFFYSWQTLYPRGFISENRSTTRQNHEVQDTDPAQFAHKLRLVFQESARVLKEHGLLVFTYHHSNTEGWKSLAEAIYGANFSVVQAHPVRSELAVATPKSQAKHPILVDALIVCRKQSIDEKVSIDPDEALRMAVSTTITHVRRLISTGYMPTEGDKFVIGASQFFVALGSVPSPMLAIQAFCEQQNKLQAALQSIDIAALTGVEDKNEPSKKHEQLTLAL